MNFAKGWSRIERVLLVVAVAVSVFAVGLLLFLYDNDEPYWLLLIPAWLPYLSARIIGWIVKGFADKDDGPLTSENSESTENNE